MSKESGQRVLDSTASAVVSELHRRSRTQLLPALLSLGPRAIRTRLQTGSWDTSQTPEGKQWLADKLVALEPEKAALCYLLCRAIGARRIVEAGTSFGLSTIYLASAVRDNLAENPDLLQSVDESPIVIGTEHEPAKVSAARDNLQRAGLADWVDVREGDLRDTLRDVAGPIDFVLLDIWIPMALPALRAIEPALRPGALVVCDAVVRGERQYREYLDHVRDPRGDYESVTIPGQGGLEISRRKVH